MEDIEFIYELFASLFLFKISKTLKSFPWSQACPAIYLFNAPIPIL